MLHPIELIEHQTIKHADAIALQYQIDQQWHAISYRQFAEQNHQISRCLLQLAAAPHSNIAIYAANSARWLISDIACMSLRLRVVPIYSTSTAEQAAYILKDSQAKICFVGGQSQFDALISQIDTLSDDNAVCQISDIILLDDGIEVPSAVCELPIRVHRYEQLLAHDLSHLESERLERVQSQDLDDIATIIYTSGTTGNPKGVMLDFRALASTCEQHNRVVDFIQGDQSLAFLPLSHIYERLWSIFVLTKGGKNAILSDPLTVKEALVQIRPQVMCTVPRLLEKIYTLIFSKVEQASWLKRTLFTWAVKQGEKSFYIPLYKNTRRYKLADKLILSKLRNTLGGKFKFIPCGGAKLDDQINLFFQSIGLHILCGYGLTETTATVTCSRIGQISLGNNGKPLPNIEVKIGEQDEVLVRGDTVMRGYYNNLAATQSVMQDGWFKTGDCGLIDEDGKLVITDRIKELMKTSNGKYIAPQRIEGLLARDAWIEQIAVIADAKHFVSALIVPAISTIAAWAKEQHIAYKSTAELLQHNDILAQFSQRLSPLQAQLANFEQVKKFTLLEREFSLEQGEITPTLKLRRKIINQHFHAEIEAMYQ